MRVKTTLLALPIALASVFLLHTVCLAGPMNLGPPTGAILDLNGGSVTHSGYTQYTQNFAASLATTDITFAFREDPAFFSFTDASVTTGGGPNLLLNGDFSSGTVGTANATNWTVLNTWGATYSGLVDTTASSTYNGPCALGGPATTCWNDGSVQAYDSINQSVATTIGDTYQISFWLNDNGPDNTFSALSTNGNITGIGGNGVDVLVYAQAATPPLPTPEPSSMVLFGTLLSMAGFLRRKVGL